MLKSLKDINIDNKKVILRVDFNVPINNGKILSTKKIDDSLKTIDYLIEHNCKIIILSHLGRIKTEEDKEHNSLKLVFNYLKLEKGYNILFCAEPMSEILKVMANNLNPKQLILVENTRFLDLNGNLESGNDIQLSYFWADLADFYVNDAFGSMHRNHASVVGIPSILPSAIGFLVENEIKNLQILKKPTPPFIILMGGAKLEEKLELIYNLIEKCDYILFGGGLATTFLKAAGFEIGTSLYSEKMVPVAKMLLKEFPDKIILPKDVIVSPSYSKEYIHKSVDEITIDDQIGDIGTLAITNYKKLLESAGTIFVNGTVGRYEIMEYSNGTRLLLEIIANSKSISVIGGGDATSALEKFGFKDKVTFASTGGGATLSYIAEETLPGLEIIGAKNEEDIC